MRSPGSRIAAVALLVGPAWLTLATMPMPWYARLTLFVPALALPLAAVALSTFRPRAATIGGLALVGLAAVSLVHANIRPNINIRAAFAGDAGRVSPLEYLAYVLDPSDTRRASVSLRAECALLDVIPAGSRVVPGGFILLHGVVGPRFERILTEPISAADDDPAALVAAMRGRDATWLVTGTSSPVSRAAESAPGTFRDHGVICEGGRLWQLAGGS
jgi:hypothetical protein